MSIDNEQHSDFHHGTPIFVRFHDLDALGHVNNARYLNYLEVARMAYVRDVCGWNGRMDTLSMIVASVKIDFKLPIHLGDELTVFSRVSRLGNKSLDMRYWFEIVPHGKTDPVLAATATVTVVMYDYDNQHTIPINSEWREAITQYETAIAD